MKKILIAIPALPGGGAEKVLLDLVKRIDKSKFLIDIFLIEKEGVYLKEILKHTNSLNSLFQMRNRFNKYIIVRKAISILRRPKRILLQKGFIDSVNKTYDIEISFLEGIITEYISNRKSNAKKIAWIHTDLEKHRVMSIEEERKIYKKFNTLVCVSKQSKQSVLNLYPEYKDKVQVIYNPIDKEEIISKAQEPVEDIREGKITLVTAGRLSQEKGYDLLLEAHNQLLKEGLDYNLVILGEGGLKGEFEGFIKKNNMVKNTKLLGFQSNPYSYLKQGDIFVMPSRYEGYPLVLCEAVTLGKPIISTQCTGPTEILENGKYGMLVPTEDVLALKNAMREMIEEEELRKKYSQLAVERSEIFNIEDVMKQIENLFDN